MSVGALSDGTQVSPNLAHLIRVRRFQGAVVAWTLSCPAAVLMAVMVLIPTLAAVALAFTNYQLGARSITYVGLDNFAQMLGDRVFWKAFKNTLVYTAISVPTSVALGLGVALLIEKDPMGRAVFRAIYFLPVASLLVAMATVWEMILHPDIGIVNVTLSLLGIKGPDWLGDPDTVLLTLAFIFIWKQVGYNMILFVAGLKTIPNDLYQAAAIDGVDNAFERFRIVTWPLLAPTMIFVVVVTTLLSFQVFDTVAALTQGGPANASNVLLYNLYTEAFVFFRTGYAAAMVLVFLGMILLVTLLQVKYFERKAHYL